MGQCKLCLGSSPLCESHIIPEFCYDPLKEEKEKNRMAVIRLDGKRSPPRQKGFWDYLLCVECEQRINRDYETPFREYWFHQPALPKCVPLGSLFIKGFDYTVFKLFHLSILWRASISRLRCFGAVSLGAHYEDKIRLMLLKRNPGLPEDFPIIGVVVADADDCWSVRKDLIRMPTRHRFANSHAYSFAYCGCEWVVFVTDHPSRELRRFTSWVPQVGGTMMLAVKDLRESFSVKMFSKAFRSHQPTNPQAPRTGA